MHRHPGLRRTAGVLSALALLAGLVLAVGSVTGTFALFSAETENPNAAFAGGWIPPPSGLSDSVTGAANDQLQLSWTSGHSASQPSPNPVTGQQLQIADGGSGSTASCGAYGDEGSALSATATSATDGGGSVPVADWHCYQMVSLSSVGWKTSAEFPAIQLLVPVSVVFGGNGNGKLDNGETITITYNQDVAAVAVDKGICQVKGTSANGFLVLGFTGTCSSSASYAIGKITGITVGKTGSTTATVSVSGPVVTITATAGGAEASRPAARSSPPRPSPARRARRPPAPRARSRRPAASRRPVSYTPAGTSVHGVRSTDQESRR